MGRRMGIGSGEQERGSRWKRKGEGKRGVRVGARGREDEKGSRELRSWESDGKRWMGNKELERKWKWEMRREYS